MVKSCESAFMGNVQNLLLASILLTFETVPKLDTMSWKVQALCTLNVKALFLVHGSRHTLNFPFGL